MRIADVFTENKVIRALRTRDHAYMPGMMTYDASFRTHDGYGNNLGRPLINSYGQRFAAQVQVPTYDRNTGSLRTDDNGRPVLGMRTADSTGAFLVGELERLDLTLHEPLADVTWGRDIDLREDVTIGDEVSSFTLTTYGSQGGNGTGNGIGNGKSWIGKNTDQISGIGVDIAKIPHPLTPWGLELKYTILELESSALLGRPIDAQKYSGLQLKHQMDVDEQVYIGDVPFGQTGLVNADLVTNVQNVDLGASGFRYWSSKTPAEILADINAAITSVWQESAYAIMPNRILIPPQQFGYLSSTIVSQAGNFSLLKYLLENNIIVSSGRGRLEILPLKWLVGAAVGGTIGVEDHHDRMVVYTKAKQYVRFPMTMLQRTPLQYDSIYHKTTYFCRLGVVEVVYPETVGYFDGI